MSKWPLTCRLCKQQLEGTLGPHCQTCLPRVQALGRDKAARRRVMVSRDKQGRVIRNGGSE